MAKADIIRAVYILGWLVVIVVSWYRDESPSPLKRIMRGIGSGWAWPVLPVFILGAWLFDTDDEGL